MTRRVAVIILFSVKLSTHLGNIGFEYWCDMSYVTSGGYNIKTGPGCVIELMKFDMGGSAVVLGAAKAIGQIKPPGVEVRFMLISNVRIIILIFLLANFES